MAPKSPKAPVVYVTVRWQTWTRQNTTKVHTKDIPRAKFTAFAQKLDALDNIVAHSVMMSADEFLR